MQGADHLTVAHDGEHALNHFGMRNTELKNWDAYETVFTPNSEPRTLNSYGLTLIELVIVIAILGVMLAIIIPRLGEIGEANLKQSARHLTGMIRFLRNESEATKKVLRLRFDVTGGRYWVEERAVAVPAGTGEKSGEKPGSDFRRYSSVMGSEGTLSGQTTFRDVKVASHPDDPYIQFTPDGWVEQAMIHLRNGDNKDFTLKVKPLTGNTELLDGYVEEG